MMVYHSAGALERRWAAGAAESEARGGLLLRCRAGALCLRAHAAAREALGAACGGLDTAGAAAARLRAAQHGAAPPSGDAAQGRLRWPARLLHHCHGLLLHCAEGHELRSLASSRLELLWAVLDAARQVAAEEAVARILILQDRQRARVAREERTVARQLATSAEHGARGMVHVEESCQRVDLCAVALAGAASAGRGLLLCQEARGRLEAARDRAVQEERVVRRLEASAESVARGALPLRAAEEAQRILRAELSCARIAALGSLLEAQESFFRAALTAREGPAIGVARTLAAEGRARSLVREAERCARWEQQRAQCAGGEATARAACTAERGSAMAAHVSNFVGGSTIVHLMGAERTERAGLECGALAAVSPLRLLLREQRDRSRTAAQERWERDNRRLILGVAVGAAEVTESERRARQQLAPPHRSEEGTARWAIIDDEEDTRGVLRRMRARGLTTILELGERDDANLGELAQEARRRGSSGATTSSSSGTVHLASESLAASSAPTPPPARRWQSFRTLSSGSGSATEGAAQGARSEGRAHSGAATAGAGGRGPARLEPAPQDWGARRAVVVDSGTSAVRVGLAGDATPAAVFPSIIGRPRSAAGQGELFAGWDAHERRGVLRIEQPIERGLVADWGAAERLWRHAFGAVRAAPGEQAVLLAEVASNPKGKREKTAQLLFEGLGVPALYLAEQGALSLRAAGRVTGLALHCGEGGTHAVPVYEGHCVHHAVGQLAVGGGALTDWMARLLGKRELPPGGAREAKEQLAWVAPDFAAELAREPPGAAAHRLPDGSVLTLAQERFRCPEALFQPALAGVQGPGVPDLIRGSIARCDGDLRSRLCANIVLCGGTTMCPGFHERLSIELEPDLQVVAPPERALAAWRGGSAAASLASFRDACVSKAEYDEHGPAVVHMKCF
eukprot:TRINITY_DN18801_c0_g1_i10.p1 TRINITY_DN18801_c0_g1~~TRINITY_DN18801_c0_g1_i10.p1  ORF type:complete len:917 (+),score=213.65 TRINITY_DN18801_c0_g1_i10:1205-3955(+)